MPKRRLSNAANGNGKLLDVGASTALIEPGSPWENGHVESFSGKPSDELLNAEVFNTLAEALASLEANL